MKGEYRRDGAIISSYPGDRSVRGSTRHTSVTVIVFNVIVRYDDERIIRKRIMREMCLLVVYVCRLDIRGL